MHNTLSTLELETEAHEAEAHAQSVKVLPTNETAPRQFRCVGWRATGSCSPDGPREPERDQPCTKLIPVGEAGYCEIEDKSSGGRFRALRRHCNSLKAGALFRCFEATSLVNFPFELSRLSSLHKYPGSEYQNMSSVVRPVNATESPWWCIQGCWRVHMLLSTPCETF